MSTLILASSTMASTDRDSRPYHVIVWGATGFTGKLVVEYLSKEAEQQKNLKWAIAGRDRKKLEQVKEETGANADIITARLGDQASLDNMVRQTRVLASTVGPYGRYGAPVVDACVRCGTDYCDITGESVWIREMIDKYHNTAEQKGIKIVPSCGFDSIPSDLGTLYIGNHIQEKLNKKCNKVDIIFYGVKGGASGGTLNSAMDMMSPGNMIKMLHPNLLDPQKKKKDKFDPLLPWYNWPTKMWVSPWPMAPINTRIVRRTQALLEYPYGKCTYEEGVGHKRFFKAFLSAVSLLALVLVLNFIPPLKSYVRKKFPPGSGPSKEEREKGESYAKIVAHTEPTGNQKSQTVIAEFYAKGDPGYSLTSKLLAESALCLAFDEKQLPNTSGILTAGSAMGLTLLRRLQKKGIIELNIQQDATN